MTALFKKLLAFNKRCIVLSSLFIVFFVPAVHAEETSASSLPTTNNTPALRAYQLPTYIPPTSPLYTDLLLHNMVHTFSCIMNGFSIIGQPCLTYQLQNISGVIQSVPILSKIDATGGLLGTTGGLIGALYTNRPVRSIDYLAVLGQDLGIKDVHAQVVGSGGDVLSPVVKLWQVSRNIAYLAMIIIFVIIGLMVMFRQRINPQTVITAQAALPGLVIGLILITFSYFFAGLLSDMSFIGTNLVGYYFSAAEGKPENDVNIGEKLKSENVISIFSRFVGIINTGNARDGIAPLFSALNNDDPVLSPQRLLTIFSALLAIQFVLPIGGLAGGIGQAVVGSVAGALTLWQPAYVLGLGLSFMAMAILMYSMFRLLFRLLTAYLNIIFLVVTAPFHFLVASLPGRSGLATAWFLNLFSHVLAFPAVLAVFYFVAFLLGNKGWNFGPLTASGTPIDLTNSINFPLFGGIDLDIVKILLAFGALVATPTIPDIITKIIGRPSQAGQLLGQGLTAGIGAGRGYYEQGVKGGTGLAERAGNVRDTMGYKWNEKLGKYETSRELHTGATPGRASKVRTGIQNAGGWLADPFGRRARATSQQAAATAAANPTKTATGTTADIPDDWEPTP